MGNCGTEHGEHEQASGVQEEGNGGVGKEKREEHTRATEYFNHGDRAYGERLEVIDPAYAQQGYQQVEGIDRLRPMQRLKKARFGVILAKWASGNQAGSNNWVHM